jgi:subtilisin family serine protease
LHAQQYGAQVEFVYGHALAGYAAVIPAHRLAEVQADENVAYVEADGEMSAAAQILPWGIDKIDADISSTRAGDGSGAVTNVNAYIIDTGIDYGHADLNASSSRHVNFANGPNKDCHGHGTHVAGTVAARDNATDVAGVAPGVTLWGVKVLGCGGSGSNAGVIAGIDWVTANAVKPAVANMSLGGSFSQAVNDAVIRSANSGVFYALAAGNSGANACNSSPASAGAGTNNGIMTVAATDSADTEASWSNYGSCVDIWAPGVSILSSRKGGGTTPMSGTSMASPHGAGGGALYLSGHPSASAASVEGALKAAATDTGRSSKDGRRIMREYVGGF